MKRRILQLLFGFFLFSMPLLVEGQIHYVKIGGTGDGSSWDNASGELQAVINEANEGDEVWIAEGTYLPSECVGCSGSIDSSYYTFSIPYDNITLYGGFPNSGNPSWEDRDWDNHPSILSGNIGDPNSALDNVKNVVNSDYVHLDGLIVSDAKENGINTEEDYIALTNCQIINNQENGVYCGFGNLKLKNCQVSNNQGYGVRADVGNLRLFNCRISNNGEEGASASNDGDNNPAVIYFYNCIIENNNDRGLQANIVRGDNSLFIGNIDRAISCSYSDVTNCTFTNNPETAIYSDVSAEIHNCIFWGNNSSGNGKTIDCNSPDENFISYVLTDEADCENLGSNIICGDGNIFNADDPFVSISTENFQLHDSSQAINAGGNNWINLASHDLNGLPRVQGNIVDIGAYEYNDCLLYFKSQTEIDDFSSNYPGLNEVCDVYIRSGNIDPITNLNGLSQITTAEGFLWIEKNNNITSLAGLEYLTEVGGFLHLEENQGLPYIDSLNNLTMVGQYCNITNNTNLLSINGLGNLSEIGDGLNIKDNQSLSTINGFDNLTSIGGRLDIWSNDSLSTINGLESLISIGGKLDIRSNDSLSTINGLNSLVTIGDDCYIHYNSTLNAINGLNNLTNIVNGLHVRKNNELSSIEGFSNLSSIGAYCDISYNHTLTSINGFENLILIGGIDISNNNTLTSINGFENLTEIGGELFISYNSTLTSINGFENLISIGGGLGIRGNDILSTLEGLNGLTTIGSSCDIRYNESLISLNGLQNLDSVGDYLRIQGNELLESLSGLDSLTTIYGALYLRENPLLSDLSALNNLDPTGITNLIIRNNDALALCEVTVICDYLAIPSNNATISGNTIGCNTRAEVEAACETVSASSLNDVEIQIYPNPSSGIFNLLGIIEGQVTVINSLGSVVFEKKFYEPKIDVSKLPGGIYFLKIEIGGSILNRKVIIY